MLHFCCAWKNIQFLQKTIAFTLNSGSSCLWGKQGSWYFQERKAFDEVVVLEDKPKVFLLISR